MNEEQAKLNRLLKTISMLKTPLGRTLESMAGDLEIHARTVRRYINLLEANGFLIDKSISGNRWFIVPDCDGDSNLLNFSLDEAVLIRDLVMNGAHNHPLKKGIFQKLYINSELKSLSDNLIEARINDIVNKLKRAVKSELKVVLKNYHSVNSNAIKDYLIEPHSFSTNYMAVWAYDIRGDLNKQFRTSRIGEIQVLDIKQSNISKHKSFNLDPFGYEGEERLEILLQLNLASITKLREVHPKAVKYIDRQGDKYIFRGIIHHVEGAGRFILSQAGDVKIIQGDSLIEYVRDKFKMFNSQHGIEEILDMAF